MNLQLSDDHLTSFMRNSINIIKYEYIEKQKKVVVEFQKRYKSYLTLKTINPFKLYYKIKKKLRNGSEK